MTRVLVPTDFSSLAENALKYACGLSNAMNGSILLFHTQEMPASEPTIMMDLAKVIEDSANARMKKIADEMKEQFPSVEINYAFSFGPFEFALEKYLTDHPADLIVTGSSGRQGFEKFLFGSATFDLCKRIKMPLIAVHESNQFDGFGKVVVGVDLEHLKTNVREIVSVAQTVLSIPDNAMEYFFVNLNNFAFDQSEYSISDLTSEPIHVKNISADSLEEGFEQEVKDSNADLLVVTKNSYGFIESIFHHSATSDSLAVQSVPVLVLHA